MEIFGFKLFEPDEPQEEAAISYVCRGAQLECDKGSKPSLLDMPSSHGVYRKDTPQMNIQDFKPMVNIMSFGLCDMTGNDCKPNTGVWVGGKADVLVENQPALLSNCTTSCTLGGKIKIITDGQE